MYYNKLCLISDELSYAPHELISNLKTGSVLVISLHLMVSSTVFNNQKGIVILVELDFLVTPYLEVKYYSSVGKVVKLSPKESSMWLSANPRIGLGYSSFPHVTSTGSPYWLSSAK